MIIYFFFFNDTATTEIYTLSLHDALPILREQLLCDPADRADRNDGARPADEGGGAQAHDLATRSEEHTSELQSRFDLVCRLLLEKKKETKSTKLMSRKREYHIPSKVNTDP